MPHLLIAKLTQPEISINRTSHVPGLIHDLVQKIQNNEKTDGIIIKPNLRYDKARAIIGLIGASVIFLLIYPSIIYLINNISSNPSQYIKELFLYILGIIFIFYFFFAEPILIPWLCRRKKDIYIYSGKEGIIKKGLYFTYFIPAQIIDTIIYRKSYGPAPKPSSHTELNIIFKKSPWLQGTLYCEGTTKIIYEPEYSTDQLKKIAQFWNK